MSITREQVRAAYDALGLDPDDWKWTSEVTISADEVIVTRLRHDGDRPLWRGQEPDVETLEFEVRP